MGKSKVVGKTKNVGFQIGVRRTFSQPVDIIWNFLLSEDGIKIWLGSINPDQIKEGEAFTITEELKGKIRVLKPNSHIRLKWQARHWKNNSTLQIRVISNKEKTTISFHQEYLTNEEQREEMKQYWSDILDQLRDEFDKL